MTENEIIQNETEGMETDYIAVINDLKANTVSKEQYLKLIDFAIQEGTSYFTFNIPNSKCDKCGHIVKAPINKCPKCNSENITWYTRIIGYLRPISSFSKDRQIEAAKRTYTPSNKVS